MVKVPIPDEWKNFKYPLIHFSPGTPGNWCAPTDEIKGYVKKSLECDVIRSNSIDLLETLMK